MNSILTAGAALQTISERFRRQMRLLFWESLDDGVVLWFRVRAAMVQIQQSLRLTSSHGMHALANR
ncbi:MAG: hypothetical protein H7837_10540 [Magnetococcus sp. MYC-9]